MLLYASVQDMLGTLPPAERDRLLILIGAADAAGRRKDEADGGTT